MEEHYDPANIEAEAQAYWASRQSFHVIEDPAREKFYCLSMFPYPSGKLHMGHVRNYTIGDVISRYQRMLGKNVLQPMGWDAFGLPAENAAIKNKVAPARWTNDNIAYMKGQLKRLGFGYDWERELATCTPDYYRWEQWLFTELYKKGLVYRKSSVVNWDPVDQTVLANEQVIDGRGWRSSALVERREIPQWFLRITAYADELLEELDRLEGWPDQVRTMQRNWIGRSYGVQMDFGISGREERLTIFTTRPDTLMGVTYVAVAAEHPLALEQAETDAELRGLIEECRRGGSSEAELETIEKRGLRLSATAIHPVSGEEVPIYAANFVLMGYGTGAVMAVPAHDERDHAFALKYGIPIRPVVWPGDGSEVDFQTAAFTAKGVLRESAPFDGLTSEEAFDAIAAWLDERGRGGKTVNYRLRDWGLSRQRYWGAPIPMVHCAACGIVPVPADELPVVLPVEVRYDEHTINPLLDDEDWLRTRCPACGGEGRRETDTFDTFMESSWYYARYACPDSDRAMLDERAGYWLPVDQYVGGIEHAVLHLLYARFYHKLLRDAGLVHCDEPFSRLLTQGMVVAETYFREEAGSHRHWLNPSEVRVERDEKGRVVSAVLDSDGAPVEVGGVEKMSKSKNNGADPQSLIDRFGADTVRLYTMFAAPPDQSLEWSDEGVEGAYRFLKRVWILAGKLAAEPGAGAAGEEAPGDPQQEIRREIHETLRQASYDYERHQLNTVVSACMKIVNALYKVEPGSGSREVLWEGFGILLRLLAPVAPHLGHHLWRQLGFGEDILDAPWPQPDDDALRRDSVAYVVQVNGKLRGRIEVPADAERGVIEQVALADEGVGRFTRGKTLRKVIVVPGKLVNIVAN